MNTSWFSSKTKNRIAVVKLEGVIMDSSFMAGSRGRIIQSLKLVEKLGIRAVVLRINSPGGTVGASQEIYQAVKKLRDKGIPVIASLGDVAASGGVYVAMAATKIVANPGTITGSIGVIIKSTNLQQLYHKVGVDAEVIKSGKFKDILSNHRSLTAEENLLLQGVTDDVHMQFMEAIAEGRSLSIDTIRGFADGRIFSGRQAKQLNLVDELGDFQTAVDLAKELAGIEGEPKLFNIVPAKSWWQRLFNPVTEVINVWRLHSNFRHVPLWLMPNSF